MSTRVEEQLLVALDEPSDIGHLPVSAPFGSEPECLALQGPRHEGTDGASAAEFFVRPDHEGLDPACDGLKRI